MIRARIIWGLLLLIFPKQIMWKIGRIPPNNRWKNIIRILGIRHLLQSYAIMVHPLDRKYIMGGIGLDVSHLLSTLILIFTNKSKSRLGVVDSSIAASFVFSDYLYFKKHKL